MARDNIRNFCIIAHIDHGKSTLSDRILRTDQELWTSARWRIRSLTTWTSSASAALPSRRVPCTMNYTAKDGRDLRVQPDRHPGSCGLCLRGQPQSGCLRGRDPGGGRHAGRGSADAGQHLYGTGARSGTGAHPEQDRPAQRPPGRGGAGGGGRDWPALHWTRPASPPRPA